jgi:hypothetical protein
VSSPSAQSAPGQPSTSYHETDYQSTGQAAKPTDPAPTKDQDDATYSRKVAPSATNQIQALKFDPVIVSRPAPQATAGERITFAQSAVVEPFRLFNSVMPQDSPPAAEAKLEGGPRLETNHASPEPGPGGLERSPSSAPLTDGDQSEDPAESGRGPDIADRVRMAPPDPQLSDLIAGMVAVDSQALRDQFARFLERMRAFDDWSESQPVLVRLAPVSIGTAAAAVAFEVVRRRRERERRECSSGPGGCVGCWPSLAQAVNLDPVDLP